MLEATWPMFAIQDNIERWLSDLASRADWQNVVTDKHLIVIKQPERFQKLPGLSMQLSFTR